MRPLNENVLIRPTEGKYKYELPNGIVVYLNVSYEPFLHATTTGVVAHPYKELLVGDTIYFSYLQVFNAMKKADPKMLFIDNEFHCFVDYESISAIVRDGKFMPINGYVLLEPFYEVNAFGFKNKKHSQRYGIVKYANPDSELKPGEIIIGENGFDIPLEYELHVKTERLLKCKEEWVVGLIERN